MGSTSPDSTHVDVTVEIASGRLKGYAIDGISAFLGIPFAEPPFGPLRFQPPVTRQPWSGVRDATVAGMAYPQPTIDLGGGGADAFTGPGSIGEDCLNLNVWAPTNTNGGLPVMVWIHGGGYITGSGSARSNHGWTWARDGVVYVSINYRLHVDGFLFFDEETANLGLLDQMAALRWVQENIATFGGDPKNVTVFGQSGGGVSVMHLISAPGASGLFRRAISQSGSTKSLSAMDDARRVTDRLAQILNVAPTHEAFAALPWDKTLQAVTNLAFEYLSPVLWGEGSLSISPFRTVLDGRVLPLSVVEAVDDGVSDDVDLMLGVCADEMTFAMQPLGLLDNPPPEWTSAVQQGMGVSPEWVENYRSQICPEVGIGPVMAALWTDFGFRVPTIRVAEAHADRGAATFLYEFCWPSPTMPEIGAVHSQELPFVTDQLGAFIEAHSTTFNPWGESPPQALADLMHSAWVAFARDGSPGWPRYESTQRATMRFDTTSHVVNDLGGPVRQIWQGIA
jgi:para-nitrobenzyl esterase